MFAKVLIVGNGGREHALAWKIAQSSQVQQVIVCPGNAGTREGAHPKISNLPVDSYDEIPQKSVDIGADLVIIGPEAPLADGLADRVRKVGVNVFGPSSKAAQIESSKAFCKKFMARHDIPSAEFEVFSDFSRARSYVESKFASGQKVVVKASGLAAGKGVVVPETAEDAINALKMMMVDRIFGSAADEVVIEDLLIGEEASVLAFSDGYSVALCPPAQDHKRLLDGDKGPNTGGMGAYAPTPLISQEMLDQIEKKVIQPTITGLRKEGIPFVGMLFAGLMICPDKGIQVLEFNCRFGDPETQVILPLLHTDLFSVMNACVDRCLDSVELKWAPEGTSAVTVVVASEGYPSVYPKGRVIDFSKTEAETLSTMIFHAGTSVSSEGQIITSGGRVLSVTSVSSSLDNALSEAYGHLSNISFEGMQYRSDIAQKAFRKSTQPVKSFSYRDCGVDIDAGNEAVKLMKAAVERTYGPEVLSGLGSFGGLFSAFRIKTLENPILVASTDGVGTKIKVASQLQRYDTIGHDIVNHCINDILVQGAIPLFFLDYIASSVIDPVMIATAVQGIASACEKSGCALIGGETAEMPGVYLPNEFDLAGTIIGLVDKSDLIDGQSIVPGDLVIGVKSSGLHTNGFSLARKVLDGLDWSSPNEELNGQSIGDVLLASHRPYLNEYLALKDSGISVKGMAHITGGGLIENPPRILPKTTTLEIFKGSWEVPPIFRMMQRLGNVDDMEMARVFNMGLGMLFVVSEAEKNKAMDILNELKPNDAFFVGKIIPREDKDPVVFSGNILFHPLSRAVRIGVLGSTRGTDLQAIIDAIEEKSLLAEIPIVLSNKKSAYILERARKHGISEKFVSSKGKTREEYDQELSAILNYYNVDLVLMIGYMRIVSSEFVNCWRNRAFNVHPSLLPAFGGGMDLDVHQAVLDSSVEYTGCTVHLVDEGVDSGLIIVQKSCKVDRPRETKDSLKSKVQNLEGKALIEAIQKFSRNEIEIPLSYF